MADLATGEILENYKGLLIQYCQERGLSQPTYSETQHGPADAPSWAGNGGLRRQDLRDLGTRLRIEKICTSSRCATGAGGD